MRMNHLFTRRPREYCEAPVLRRDQGQGISLIVDELGRRQMTSSAMVHGRYHTGLIANDRFSHDHLLDRFRASSAVYLRAESQHLVAICNHGCTINRSQTGDRIDGVAQ